MKKLALFSIVLVLTLLLVAGCGGNGAPAQAEVSQATMEATNTATAVPTDTITPSPTATDTPEPTTTPTSTITPTETSSPTVTSTPTATATTTPTATPAVKAVKSGKKVPPSGSEFQTCMMDPDCIPTPAPPVERLQNTENILLLGTDKREGWGSWRTDSMMLVAIDHDTNQIAVISFPRDLYVYSPIFGQKKKINVLDSLGEKYNLNQGEFKVIKDAYEYNFGIPIDHVVRVHRNAFVELIDAIGGIDIVLDCDLWEISPKDAGGYHVLHLPAGPNHLDGETALEYATFRYRTADWGRARRQQAVLAAMKNQAMQLGLITKAPQIWDIIKRNISADIGFLDMLRYVQYGLNLNMGDIHSHVFSNRELQHAFLPSGAFVLFPKSDGVIKDVLENIYDYVPISVQGTHPKGCPPTPDWADEWLASQTPTPQPQQ